MYFSKKPQKTVSNKKGNKYCSNFNIHYKRLYSPFHCVFISIFHKTFIIINDNIIITMLKSALIEWVDDHRSMNGFTIQSIKKIRAHL